MAETAIDNLHRAGFTSEQIGIAIHDQEETREAQSSIKLSSRKADVALGATTGALVVATFAAALIWYFLDFAPIWVGIVVGAIVGGIAGGVLAAVRSMDILVEEAEYLEREVKYGHAIVTVWADERMPEADAIMRRCGAYHVGHSGERPTSAVSEEFE